ncbi:hypothetical protein BpHYR1_001590 [Brachionus plicatilis]|uniref:Uncharacterized protein n=1 Tax=Brachionus plicatilis TaxID=10195 RepID=A0A3M7QJ75_BRAPC|nr:hypothetical protein BpHYR1_001590 [Brachionus plicatilis]
MIDQLDNISGGSKKTLFGLIIYKKKIVKFLSKNFLLFKRILATSSIPSLDPLSTLLLFDYYKNLILEKITIYILICKMFLVPKSTISKKCL